LSSDFNHNDLYYESQNGNENEDHVFENSSKDIELSIFEKSSIKLIKELHENKDLEDIGEVKKLGGSGLLLNIHWHVNYLLRVIWICSQFGASFLIVKVFLLIDETTEFFKKCCWEVFLLKRGNCSFNGGDCAPSTDNLFIHVEGRGVEWVIDGSLSTG